MIRIGLGLGGWSVFIALHKTKVTSVVYEDMFIRSRGPNDASILFGTLTLCLNQSRQNMDTVKVGVVDLWCDPIEDDLSASAAWAVLGRLSMLTGHVGRSWGGPRGARECNFLDANVPSPQRSWRRVVRAPNLLHVIRALP